MPIARIITSMPEFSGGLIRDLNSRGFEVHIVTPGQANSGAVDLEIRLDAASSFMQVNQEAYAPASHLEQKSQNQAEDIWTMLAAFDGDASIQDLSSAPTSSTAEVPVNSQLPEDAEVAVLQSDTATIPDRHNISEPQISTEAAQIANGPIIGETTPVTETIPERGNDPAERLSEDEEGVRELSVPRLVGALAVCAVLIFAFVAMFGHRRAPLSENVKPVSTPETTAAVPFHAATPAAAAVVPVKAAVVTNTTENASKVVRHASASEPDIAEDTVVHFGSPRKPQESKPVKPSGIRYYSDLD
jgi:hypothetical protein